MKFLGWFFVLWAIGHLFAAAAIALGLGAFVVDKDAAGLSFIAAMCLGLLGLMIVGTSNSNESYHRGID